MESDNSNHFENENLNQQKLAVRWIRFDLDIQIPIDTKVFWGAKAGLIRGVQDVRVWRRSITFDF